MKTEFSNEDLKTKEVSENLADTFKNEMSSELPDEQKFDGNTGFTEVDLLTREGQYVTTATVPKTVVLPDVLAVGSRGFMRNDNQAEIEAYGGKHYIEGFMFAPSVQINPDKRNAEKR